MAKASADLTALRAARAHVRSLVSRFDVAEFLAQTEAADCITTLAAFRDDQTLSPEFRRLCALDLLDRGYGKPTAKATVTIAAPARIDPGDQYSEQVAQTIIMASQFRELNAFVGRIPPEQWPDHIREMAGQMGEQALAAASAADGVPLLSAELRSDDSEPA